MKPDPNRSPFNIQPFFLDSGHFSISGHFFPDFSTFFSRFRPLFHLNPSISGTINTGPSWTSDFSSQFSRNLIGFDGISLDLGWIWQDLTRSGEISPHLEGFWWEEFHPKLTTTCRRLEPTNPLLLRVGCGLGKNLTHSAHGQP